MVTVTLSVQEIVKTGLELSFTTLEDGTVYRFPNNDRTLLFLQSHSGSAELVFSTQRPLVAQSGRGWDGIDLENQTLVLGEDVERFICLPPAQFNDDTGHVVFSVALFEGPQTECAVIRRPRD